MADDPDEKRFRFILERRFPEMLDPKYKVGPGRIHLPPEMAARYKAVVEEIKSLDAGEFERCYQELFRAHMEKVRAELEAARPYNRPAGRPDFAYWGKMPLWSLDEAVALSLDRAPEVATWRTIKLDVDKSALAASFARHRELYQRGMAAAEIAFPARPAAFIEWANGRSIDLPQAMIAAVNARAPIANLKESYVGEVERRQELERELEHLKAEVERVRGNKVNRP